jgi:glycosyltransferase involved in cell wall biosynthesis
MAYQRAALAELAGTMDVVCSSVRGPLFGEKRFTEYPLTGRALNSFNHYVLFYRHVWKHCRPAEYDFLYIRYPLAIPSFLRFLRDTKRANPATKIIVEVATFPYRQELRSPKQRVLLALDDLGHGRLKDYVDVIVTFFGQSEIFGIPCIPIANGIDMDSIPFKVKASSGRGVSMIVVANLARWHGIDRMLRGLAEHLEHKGARPVVLSIVGDGPAANGLRALTRDLGLEDVVRFHGMHSGAELDALFANADLALSSLGMHRLGLHRSSSLKAREYCARGIPFVIASDDPDFPEGVPFVYRVAADESPIDVAAVVEFIDKLRERSPEYMMEMRRYAEKRLTWKAKLEPVVHYVRTGEFQTTKELP